MTAEARRRSFTSSSNALQAIRFSVTAGESKNFDLNTSSANFSSSTINDPPYLFNQLRSAEWIQRYGLKSQKLTFDQILQQIGFKRVETFDPVVGKTVAAKYAANLYHEVQQDNGDRYVLTCRPEKLREFHQRLISMMNFLRKRLHFISSGSRRLFGVISEPSVCLICDCKTIDHRIFNQYQVALTSLVKEQIAKIKRVNIVWVSNDNEQFNNEPIDVSASNLDRLMDWIGERKCSKGTVSVSATCEAFTKAFKNDVHAIYLISEGDSSDSAREMLRDTIVKTRLSLSNPIPVHVVSLYCHNNDTQVFLRSIAESADGSYFCYKIKSELSDLKAPSNLSEPTRIQIQNDKLQFGTNALTPIPQYPADINLMFKEINQCQTVIDRIENILGFIRNEKQNSSQSFETKSLDAFNVSGEQNFQKSVILQSSNLFSTDENEMTSADWLKAFGIDAQKLDFFSVLQAAAFRHCDGVVQLLKPPVDATDPDFSSPANPTEKLINAKYCDQFAHVVWPDGTVRHVHVTPELYRDYERRIRAVLEKIKARLSWLKKGSRDVFGTILENNIYILIDTSKSMHHHLAFVKEKLRLLIQDQLSTKEKVNVVAFNSTVNPWRDRLTRIYDSTTFSQLQPWIDGLSADGTTNTLGAIRFALADSATEAIYLLTDGRPDQSERHILSQVQYRQTVPIHTIAFNCQDQTANQFLYDLSKQTGGRFHTFNYGVEKTSAVEIPESEDVGLLKQEFIRGEKELARIAALRDECTSRAWSHENLFHKTNKYQQRINPENSITTLVQAHYAFEKKIRTDSAPVSRRLYQRTDKNKRKLKQRSLSAQTIPSTSVLGVDSKQWLLPETWDFIGAKPNTIENSTDSPPEHKPEKKKRKIRPPRTPYDEVESYLKKNSLYRRGLTIFDVLHPTMVNVRDPKHIQVIDRHVLAKVWDDILPLAYGSYVGKLRLINHYAVNLIPYENDLREILIRYQKYTSNFIWKHLDESEKEKIAMHLHWETLSMDQRDSVKQEISADQYKNQNDLEYFAWRKLTKEEQDKFIQDPPEYQDNIKDRVKKSLEKMQAKSVLEGVTRMDTEIMRAVKFLQISTDLRSLQTRADAENKPQPKPPRPRPNTNYGRMICRYDDDGFYRRGKIQTDENGEKKFCFENGVEQTINGHTLLPINGAIAQPQLVTNDYVLVHQNLNNDECWVPGIILLLPSPSSLPDSLYTICIFLPDQQQIHANRRNIIKISPGLFEQILRYLKKIKPKTNLPKSDENHSQNFEKILKRQLKPIKKQIGQISDEQNRRYEKLKRELDDQSQLLAQMQRRSSADSGRIAFKSKKHVSLGPVLSWTRDRDYETNEEGSNSSASTSDRIDEAEEELPDDTEKKPGETNFTARSDEQNIIPDSGGSHRDEQAKPPAEPASERSQLKSDFEDNPSSQQISSRTRRSVIDPGTHVYAICEDEDGFGYKAVVQSYEENDQYLVKFEGYHSFESVIHRDDIYLESDLTMLCGVDSKTFCLARYPDDERECWSPAAIVMRCENANVFVRFYNCYSLELSEKTNVIPITRSKFKQYTMKRLEVERMIGPVVVGFDEKDQTFKLGKIRTRDTADFTYIVEWFDGRESLMEEKNLFGAFRHRMKPEVDQFVIASDDKENIFRLGKIVAVSSDSPTITVRFSDLTTEREAEMSPLTVYQITETYHDAILKKIQSRS